MSAEKEKPRMDVKAIAAVLPHRYPFLLVDRILELEPRKSVVAIKNVTMNEPFFQGHFPGEPVMPGVLQVEAMAQAAGVMMMESFESGKHLAFLMALNNVKFRRPVVPGDQLVIKAETVRTRARMGVVKARMEVEGKVVSEAEITFSIVDRGSAETEA